MSWLGGDLRKTGGCRHQCEQALGLERVLCYERCSTDCLSLIALTQPVCGARNHRPAGTSEGMQAASNFKAAQVTRLHVYHDHVWLQGQHQVYSLGATIHHTQQREILAAIH